jgi:hypothetical protein
MLALDPNSHYCAPLEDLVPFNIYHLTTIIISQVI